MKLVQQGDRSVCQLAALAMVAEVSLEEAEKAALSFPKYRHRSWEGIFKSKDRYKRFWEYTRHTITALGLPEHLVPEAIDNVYGSPWEHEHAISCLRGVYHPVLLNRGIIMIRSLGGTGHATAFENGMVYDPNETKPYQWVDLLESYPWADRVVVTRVDGAPVTWKVFSWEREKERKMRAQKRRTQ